MKHFFLVLTIATLSACGSPVENAEKSDQETPAAEKRLAQLKWLIGRWENNSEAGNLSEIWQQRNDSTLVGTTYFVVQGDTVFAETVELAERNGTIDYCVTIPDQNNGETTCFALTKLAKQQLAFENPKHDYPTKITYDLKGDSLLAEISGTVKGKPQSEQFRMKKAR